MLTFHTELDSEQLVDQTENERKHSPSMALIDDAISFLFRHYLSKILKS